MSANSGWLTRRYAVGPDTAYVTPEEDTQAATDTAYLALLPHGPIVLLEGSAYLLFWAVAAEPDGALGEQVLAAAREAAAEASIGAPELAEQVAAFLTDLVTRGFLVESGRS
ncbi:MAG: hypothetical protein IPL93_07170 [Actinomycetales bacterium]|jgi:hypothetical protein|nr:hypothetical protein [Actinomycetales bacterium]